jgi:predicted transposase/invertase (TIGR01784 family)
MFSNHGAFGNYVLNFEYMLVNAKGYDDDTLKNFSSKLLGLVLMQKKKKNDVEFYSRVRDNLDFIKTFDNEEKRILNLCIKITDIAYGYNKSDDIQKLLSESQIQEVDGMLCDMIEYAQVEKEELRSQGVSQGELQKALQVARNLLKMNMPLEKIMEATGLTANEIEGL